MDKDTVNKISKAKEGIASTKPSLKCSPLAKKLLIKGESLRLFEDLRVKTLSETLPQTEIENILVEKIISSVWRLRRAMEVERNLFNEQNRIKDDEQFGSSWEQPGRKRVKNIKKIRMESPEIQHIIQYQLDLEKGLHRALARLREEQALRF